MPLHRVSGKGIAAEAAPTVEQSSKPAPLDRLFVGGCSGQQRSGDAGKVVEARAIRPVSCGRAFRPDAFVRHVEEHRG
jgi:hypothetical protein